MKAIPISGDAKSYAILIGVGVAGVLILAWFAKQQLKEGADTIGGLVSGNNAITKGTVYEGDGVLGTLGAAANTASGGTFQSLGEWLGGKAADAADWWRLPSNKTAVSDNFYADSDQVFQ